MTDQEFKSAVALKVATMGATPVDGAEVVQLEADGRITIKYSVRGKTHEMLNTIVAPALRQTIFKMMLGQIDRVANGVPLRDGAVEMDPETGQPVPDA